jgi:ketosteroid isomerase-like protein
MALDNEQVVRRAYQIAEDKDMTAWVAAFTDDGTFTDESIGVTWSGPDELPVQVENYARAFPDMHRELHQLYVSADIVVVLLALQGTHLGPLHMPAGTLPPTGHRMDAPCCDVFELVDGKIKRFDCYPEGTVILTRLGPSSTRTPAPCSAPDRYRVASPILTTVIKHDLTVQVDSF